jgi:proteasome accessory factor C
VTTTDRLSRLLELVPWLRAHPGVSLAEAADTFGITVRQLRDDLDLLFVCGLPGGAPGDLIDLTYSGDRITVLDPQTLDRPLKLTADEASALLVAARTLADIPGLAGRDALERAIDKIGDAVGEAAGADVTRERVQVQLDSPRDTLRPVQDALATGRRIRLRYLVWSRDELTERDVDPIRVFTRDGHWYLEGWCHRADAVRVFRLDRVHGPDGARVLDVPAAPPPAVAADPDAGTYRPHPDDPLVTLEVYAGARWVADYYPAESRQELADGGLRLELRVSDLRWLRRLVLGLGSRARVVAPPAAVGEIHGAAAAALAAYGVAVPGPAARASPASPAAGGRASTG